MFASRWACPRPGTSISAQWRLQEGCSTTSWTNASSPPTPCTAGAAAADDATTPPTRAERVWATPQQILRIAGQTRTLGGPPPACDYRRLDRANSPACRRDHVDLRHRTIPIDPDAVACTSRTTNSRSGWCRLSAENQLQHDPDHCLGGYRFHDRYRVGANLCGIRTLSRY